VAWTDQYILSNTSADDPSGSPGFADFRAGLYDIQPPSRIISARGFPTAFARRLRVMMFNLTDYGRTLMTEFTAAGGKFQHMELHEPRDLTGLKEKVVINCPGYGARALWGDATVTPVRGQIVWLVPQPEVTYSLLYRDVIMLSRRDGIAIQAVGGNWRGFYETNEAPDRVAAETAINTIAELCAKFASRPA
jgi:hypothetical protein